MDWTASDGDRALSNRILLYFATLVVVVMLWIVLNGSFNTMMGYTTTNCATAACSTGATWVQSAWDNFFWFALTIGLLMLVTAAIFESRRPGV